MATVTKDFRVKNGLYVTEDASISGTVSVGDVSSDSHAATKEYAESLAYASVSGTAPSSPLAGKMWVDTSESRLKIWTGSSWVTLATMADANTLQDHIHDDAIEGTGRISSVVS